MVQFCCVIGCGNRSNRERKQFHRLPNISKKCNRASFKAEITLRRRKQWLLNIGRTDLKDGDEAYSPGYIRVCSDHFVSGKPSLWSDVESINWAPTLQMGHGKEVKKSPRKRPQRNTAQKRAMRVKELQKKKMLLGIVANTKQNKMIELKETNRAALKIKRTSSDLLDSAKQKVVAKQKGKLTAKKTTRPSPQLKRRKVSPNLLRGSMQTRKKVKSPKQEATEQYSTEIQRMLKKQEIKVRRKVLELELTSDSNGYPPKLTENPFIHKITVDSIVFSPEQNAETKESTSTDLKTRDSGNELVIKRELIDNTPFHDTVTNMEYASTDLNTEDSETTLEIRGGTIDNTPLHDTVTNIDYASTYLNTEDNETTLEIKGESIDNTPLHDTVTNIDYSSTYLNIEDCETRLEIKEESIDNTPLHDTVTNMEYASTDLNTEDCESILEIKGEGETVN